MYNVQSLIFKKASIEHKNDIFEWLEKPHVKEFWDNSQEHRDDILIFMQGRKESSPYWNGMFDYWVGIINNHPFCLLMTSEVKKEEQNLPQGWYENLSPIGKTFSIDFMIGNEKYLGKGLAGITLEAFTQFIPQYVDQSVTRFIIDPAANNLKAKHVYEKAGFHTVAEFTRNNANFFLMIKRLCERQQ